LGGQAISKIQMFEIQKGDPSPSYSSPPTYVGGEDIGRGGYPF